MAKPIPCHDLIKGVIPYNLGPYINCIKELGPGASTQQIADCFDDLPADLKKQLGQAVCNYLACMAAHPAGGLPTDPCTTPGVDPIYCCWEKYAGDVCKCVAQNANNVGLGACLGLAYNKAIACAEAW